jgi:hypothetical protein
MFPERWGEPRRPQRGRYGWELMRPDEFSGNPRSGPRYDEELERARGHDREASRRGIDRWGNHGTGYGADYWWLGEREMERRGYRGGYDEAYRRFDEGSHPRYSPVGGMYPAMGGRFAMRRPPRELRGDTRFSDWTRWF